VALIWLLPLKKTVIQWMRKLFGFQEHNSGCGIIVSGTLLATVIYMAIARKRVLVNIRENGLANEPKLATYTSIGTHNYVVKAFKLLELKVNQNNKFYIKIDELKKVIHDDRE
jgi:glutamate/tyrosine decarboxylase-like PLP-dependent enzyme